MRKPKILVRILLLMGFVSFLVGCGNTKTYTVTFMVNDTTDSTVEVEKNLRELPEPSLKGYTFNGWYLDKEYSSELTTSTLITEDINVYAKFSVINYTITYAEVEDATNSNPTTYNIESDTIELVDAVKTGYMFDGWYNGSTKVEEIAQGSTENITLTAHWKVSEYTITYKNTKEAINSNEGGFNFETPTFDLKDLSNVDGYKFKCWNDENGEVVTSIPKGTARNLSLTAEWDIVEYNITYKDEFNVENKNVITYTIETDTFKLSSLSKTGYRFDGWYDGSTKVEEIEIGTVGNIELEARWTTIYTIAYDEADYKINVGQNIDATYFNARCIDINNNELDIEISVVISGNVEAGNTVSATLSTTNSEIEAVTIENIKVLGTPTITATKTEYLPLRDDISEFFIGKDTFGNELDVTCNVKKGTLTVGSEVEVEVSTVDSLGNTTSAIYSYTVILDDIFEVSDGVITGLNSKGENLENIIIPNEIGGVEITGIGASAFNSNYTLKTVFIASGISRIEEKAFYLCKSLVSINIPEDVTYIGASAFRTCTNLRKIVIPTSVTTIESYGFYDCKNVVIVTEFTSKPVGWSTSWISRTPVYWGLTEDATYTDGVFMYVIKDGKAIVARYVNEQEEVIIPSQILVGETSYDVIGIGDSAFYLCSTMTSIRIPSSITSIGKYAFYDCSSLTKITIPTTVTTIGNFAFEYCYSLSIFTDLTTKPGGWDSNWNARAAVYWGLSEDNAYTDGVLMYVIKDRKASVSKFISNQAEITIPSQITFNGISYDVTSMEDYAFYSYRNLTKITILASLTKIGNYAFYGCSNLTNVTLPDSISTIGDCAFYSCSNLTNVTLPADLRTIGNHAFYRCSNLTYINLPSSLESIGMCAFYACSSLTSITIPSSVTNVSGSAFYGCTNLTIYCLVSSKPSTWDSSWNESNCPVVWGEAAPEEE